MGVVPNTPHWVYDALARDPKPALAPWPVRIAPFVVMLLVGLIGLAVYLSYKGVPL